jgi:methylmalonyl-CoA/ethylmalonyl-CoA epimerase
VFTKIHHVGILVPDLDAAKRLWVDAYGFTVDESRSPLPQGRHVNMSNVDIIDIPVGESEIELIVPKDPESDMGRHLAIKGPGLHHLCLYTDNLEEDMRNLKNAGLKQRESLSCLSQEGDNHRATFFHPEDNLGVLLELWENILPKEQLPKNEFRVGGGLSRIHHIGLVAPDLGGAIELFCDVYGLRVDQAVSPLPDGRLGNDNVRVVDIPVGESEIEVVIPQDAESGTARFLASRGPGMHHICFYTEDIHKEMKRLREAGLQEIGFVSFGKLKGESIGWLHPKSNMGVLVEIWQDPLNE